MFSFKNGRVYDGEFIDDRMAEFPTSSTIFAEESVNGISLLGINISLNIETILHKIPEAQRKEEVRQVSVVQTVHFL